jgi:superfamily II DNA or RNA helicase
MIYLSKLDEVFFEVQCNHDEAISLRDYLKCYSPGYRFDPRYKRHFWDGKISFFSLKDYKLPIGLYDKFIEWIKINNFQFESSLKQTSFNINDEFIKKFYEIIFENTKIRPRYYQNEAFKAVLKNKRGIIESATGSGKTLFAYILIRYLLSLPNRRILIVVPNVQLVEQILTEFKDTVNGYGWDKYDDYVTIMYQDHMPDLDKPVLISTYQSLIKKDESFIARYNTLIIDECHGAKSKTIKDICIAAKFADIKIGMTGTLPSVEEIKKVDQINKKKWGSDADIVQSTLYTIFGYIGPKIYTIKSAELIEKGILSDLTVAIIFLKYPKEIIEKNRLNKDFELENKLIETYPNRNIALDKIFNIIPKEENSLILCQKIEHLNSVYEYIKALWSSKFNIEIIHGGIHVKKRLEICNNAERNGNTIIVATYGTMSVGVNIKRLHNIILWSQYKSKIKILQTLGRGLRKHETKDKMVLYDIVDDLRWIKRGYVEGENDCWGKNYMFKQYEYRKEYYSSQGFEVKSHTINI